MRRSTTTGAAVDNQRWQWELAATSTTSGLTFRIHNVSTGLCLDRDTSNAVVANVCGTATTQQWRAPLDDPYGGWTLANAATGQCLQVVGANTAPGALLQTASCTGSAAQRWRMRPAPLDCTYRSREWTDTDLCAIQSSERMVGAVANWRTYPIRINWLDPSQYVLANTVNTYVDVEVLNPDYSQSYTGVEFGSRAERSIDMTGQVFYGAYWLEWGSSSEQYHMLTTTDAPRSDLAEGRNHSFMLLATADGQQWDLLYDYNKVGTTTLTASGSTRITRTGLAVRYLQAVATDTPFDIRLQLMDGSGVWRRPYLSETATAEPKTCEAPPRFEDWNYDQVNLPPYCFTTSYKTRPPDVAGDPTQLDSFTVAKPGTTTTTAMRWPSSELAVGEYNGVDQDALAACLAAGVDNCIGTVPGLAACVATQAVCNITNRSPAAARPAEQPMSADQARDAAVRDFRTTDLQMPVTVVTVTGADLPTNLRMLTGADTVATGQVHVVHSTARVRSMAVANPSTYDGYTAVYDATRRQLLYACLGSGCPAL